MATRATFVFNLATATAAGLLGVLAGANISTVQASTSVETMYTNLTITDAPTIAAFVSDWNTTGMCAAKQAKHTGIKCTRPRLMSGSFNLQRTYDDQGAVVDEQLNLHDYTGHRITRSDAEP